MTVKIEERVIETFHAGMEGNFVKGMNLICPAIEATARKHLRKEKVTGEEFKSFIRNSYPIIEAFIGAGLNLNNTTFPSTKFKTDGGKEILNPDFADIIYHAFRCSLAHGHEIEKEFYFTKSDSQGFSFWLIQVTGGRINMPDKVIWALIACVVFSEANANIVTKTNLSLTWSAAPHESEPLYYFNVDVFWGAENLVKRFLASRDLLRVSIRLGS